MRCFSFTLSHDPSKDHVAGIVEPGIRYRGGDKIIFGDYYKKPGDEPPYILFDKDDPPYVKGGLLLDASIRSVDDDRIVVLCSPKPGEEEVLLRVSSANLEGMVPLNDPKAGEGSSFRHVPIRVAEGRPEFLLRGLKWHTVQGHRFEIQEDLCMCSEGDAVLVKPAGAHRKEVRIIRKGLSDFTIHKGIISPGQEAFATGMIGGEAIGV